MKQSKKDKAQSEHSSAVPIGWGKQAVRDSDIKLGIKNPRTNSPALKSQSNTQIYIINRGETS